MHVQRTCYKGGDGAASVLPGGQEEDEGARGNRDELLLGRGQGRGAARGGGQLGGGAAPPKIILCHCKKHLVKFKNQGEDISLGFFFAYCHYYHITRNLFSNVATTLDLFQPCTQVHPHPRTPPGQRSKLRRTERCSFRCEFFIFMTLLNCVKSEANYVKQFYFTLWRKICF